MTLSIDTKDLASGRLALSAFITQRMNIMRYSHNTFNC
jgi:hypothetical protein